MNPDLKDLKSTTFFGKRFTRKQIADIQTTIKTFSGLSRRELGHTICEHLQWFTPNGSDRIQSCLGVLAEMEKLGIIDLPSKIESQKRGPIKKIVWTNQTNEQEPIICTLEDLTPINLQLVTEEEHIIHWSEFLDRYHYLGHKRPMGTYLRYYIIDRHGRKLGCLLFSFATRYLACRDQWIGWQEKEREKSLHLIVNNNRFLIFPWVTVKDLASKALSIAVRQIPKDWDSRYGYRPVLLETFVDPDKYKGTCYKAANWQHIGKTAGRKTKNKKEVFVYPLTKDFRSVLLQTKKNSPLKKTSSTIYLKRKNNVDTDDSFVQLWQKIIGTVINVANEFDSQWQKRHRVINTLLLILFIFRLVFSKNKQGYGITIIELWEQCRTMQVPLPQSRPVAPSAFCNARAKLDENIFKILNTKIIATYATEQEEYQWKHHRIFAVDGSKINLPRQLLSDSYEIPSQTSYYPQGLVSCLYQLKSKIPVDFDLVSHNNERHVALTHLRALEQNDVVIYDRGYFSYTMLHAHHKRGIHAVFRLPTKLYKVIDDFIASQDTDRVVIIEASIQRQQELRKTNSEMEFIPLVLRLIKYVISGVTYTLGTTLTDSNQYKAEEFSDVYHSRWGIEELYKISKVLIDIEDFHGHSERGVKQELFAHFILITLSRIFSNHADDGQKQNEKTDNPHRFKVNFKNCLITIARNLEGLFIQQASRVKKTIDKVMDAVFTCRHKERPNRSYERQSKKPIGKWIPRKASKTLVTVNLG